MVKDIFHKCKYHIFHQVLLKYFTPGLIYIILRKIKERNVTGVTSAPDAVAVLALNSIRFRGELEILIRTGKIRIFELPFEDQTRYFHYFYTSQDNLEDILSAQTRLKDKQEKYQAFLAEVLKVLQKKISLHAVISSNYMYKQDFDWGRAAKTCGLKYFILYRGGMLTCEGLYEEFVQRYKRLKPFTGEKIIVHNNHAAKMFIESGLAAENQISCLGSPRMDRFVKNALDAQNDNHRTYKYAASLFSFGHSAGLFGDTLSSEYNQKFDSIWSRNNDYGYINLFHQVHKIFIKVALENPDKNFVIKTKWKDMWFDKIAKIAEELSAIALEKIPNLVVTDEENPHDIILSSQVVCSFGSTTLLEAALAGTNVVMPLFCEAAQDSYRRYVPFRDMQNLFTVAHSPEEFKQILSSSINNPLPISEELQGKRNKAFEEFISPLHADTAQLYAQEIAS